MAQPVGVPGVQHTVVLVHCEDRLRDRLETILRSRGARLARPVPDLTLPPLAERGRDWPDDPLFIAHVGPGDQDRFVLLWAAAAGKPLLALVEPGLDLAPLLSVARAGAFQMLPLPLNPGDFLARLETLDAPDSAARERPLTLAPGRRGWVIALCGVTGGAGATTLALNLAAEMARPSSAGGGQGGGGIRCLLVELARQAGTLASHLALEPPQTVADVLADPASLTPASIRRAVVSLPLNLDVLVGPYQSLEPVRPAGPDRRDDGRSPGWGGQVPWRRVIPLIDACRGLAPLVVLDVPCTFDDLLFETLGLADRVLLVGVQTVSSLRTMQMLRETAEREEGVQQPFLVINRFDANVPGLNARALADLLHVPRVWTVADDYSSVMTALYHGRPIRDAVPHSRALADLSALARVLREEGLREVGGPADPELGVPADGSAGPRPLRVLHVEDEEVQRLHVMLLLRSIPDVEFRVVSVASEAEAVETFRSAGEPGEAGFDLVLLDYHLSQGNGLNCLRQLRRLDPLVPIIVVSALSQPQVASELLSAGADDFVSKKNLSAARLGNCLRSVLARVEACRLRLGNWDGRPRAQGGDSLFEQVQRTVTSSSETERQQYLDDLRAGGWPAGQEVALIQRVVDLVCKELRVAPEHQGPVATALLTLFLRLFGGAEHPAAC